MQYLALIYTDETIDRTAKPDAMSETLERYFAFNAEAGKAGVLLGGDALKPTATATTVRLRDGKLLTTDGPFAETKEQLGGYYLLECDNLDEALQWAAKIPAAEHGSIEVRPIMKF